MIISKEGIRRYEKNERKENTKKIGERGCFGSGGKGEMGATTCISEEKRG